MKAIGRKGDGHWLRVISYAVIKKVIGYAVIGY
jgi:hypothetical protein